MGVCVRAPASSSQRSRPDTAAAKRGAETGCARPMPPFRIGSMSGAVQPALVRRGDSSVSPVRPERRQTKGVARVSSMLLCLSRERRRAAKFELRLRPHNTRRWSTDEGDYILSMRGRPLFRSLLSKSSLEALRRPGPRGSTWKRSRGVPESLLRDMQASGWSSAVLCTNKPKGPRPEPRAVLLVRLHRVKQWFGRLPIARHSTAKSQSPACAKGLGCVRECTKHPRNSNGTK